MTDKTAKRICESELLLLFEALEQVNQLSIKIIKLKHKKREIEAAQVKSPKILSINEAKYKRSGYNQEDKIIETLQRKEDIDEQIQELKNKRRFFRSVYTRYLEEVCRVDFTHLERALIYDVLILELPIPDLLEKYRFSQSHIYRLLNNAYSRFYSANRQG